MARLSLQRFAVYIKALSVLVLHKGRVADQSISLSFGELVLYYTPRWYHDFEELGVKTYFCPEDGYEEDQRIKKYKIFKYIDKTISLLREKADCPETISAVELFCADGFYSNYLTQRGAGRVVGIDLEDGSGEGESRANYLHKRQCLQFDR